MSKRVSFFCGAPPPSKKERKEGKERKEKGSNDVGDEGNILRSLAKSTLYFLNYIYILAITTRRKGVFFFLSFYFIFISRY